MLELKRLSLNFNFITEIDLTNMRMNNLEVFNLSSTLITQLTTRLCTTSKVLTRPNSTT